MRQPMISRGDMGSNSLPAIEPRSRTRRTPSTVASSSSQRKGTESARQSSQPMRPCERLGGRSGRRAYSHSQPTDVAITSRTIFGTTHIRPTTSGRSARRPMRWQPASRKALSFPVLMSGIAIWYYRVRRQRPTIAVASEPNWRGRAGAARSRNLQWVIRTVHAPRWLTASLHLSPFSPGRRQASLVRNLGGLTLVITLSR